ncbi:MAG: hypothetical protein AAB757_03165 [Patescibacteria group bacterium]
MNEDINIQTQNFDSSKVGEQGVGGPGQIPASIPPIPEQPNKKTGWIIFLLIFVIIVSGAVTYYFLTKKTAAPITEVPAVQSAPQAAAPEAQTPEDSIDLIDNDLNAIDLNALDTQTNSDVQDLDSSL